MNANDLALVKRDILLCVDVKLSTTNAITINCQEKSEHFEAFRNFSSVCK